MENLEFQGMWWLPEQNRGIAGTLSISSEREISLHLVGAFRSFGLPTTTITYPLVLGVTTNGHQVTLYNCIETGYNFSTKGQISFATERLYVTGAAYIGAHFSKPEDIHFYKVEVQYSHLSEWADLFRPNVEHTPNNFNLTYNFPNPIAASLPNVSISIVPRFHSEQNDFQVRLHQPVHVEFETKEELSLEEWLSQYVVSLQNLLSFATQEPNAIHAIHAYSRQVNTSKENGELRENAIQVFFPQYYSKPELSEKLDTRSMLFTLRDAIDDFDQIIEKWLKISNELSSVCSLFFAVQYSEKLFLEYRFLNFIQAVESYHRLRLKKDDISDEHQQHITAIMANVPSEHRRWLEDKLRYSHEPSLRQRLRELIDTTNEIMLPLIVDKKMFIQRVLDTRNYMTHHDPSSVSRVATGEVLFILTQTLSLLVQACFLRELGISDQKCVDFFQRTREYRNILSMVQKHQQ